MLSRASPIISVIIPFLNAGKYLGEAVESVLAQTNPSWELLLVDDGSTDEGPSIAFKYQTGSHGKIRVLHHDGHRNLGMRVSRDLGFRNSEGRYIARLDADDQLMPTAFEDQIELLDANPSAAMTYGPAEIWSSWSGGTDFSQSLSVPRNTPIPPPNALLAFLDDSGDEPVGMLIRREIYAEIGGYSGSDLYRELYEDIAVCVKICLRHPVIASDRIWYRYRQHSESCCALARSRNELELGCLRFLEWVGRYLDQEGAKDSDVWRVLQRRTAIVRASVPE
jgi:glycosyltransferase involved in cell wall biosynthesis